MVLLEGFQGRGWLDLTFGLLEGWWRFADRYRKEHPLAGAAVWRKALADAGFPEVAVSEFATEGSLWAHGLIMARGPTEVAEQPGLWVLASADPCREETTTLAEALAARNQTVVLASGNGVVNGASEHDGVVQAHVEPERREAWHALLEGLPREPFLRGVVHLAGLDGRGTSAPSADLEQDTKRIGATALALVQGLLDAESEPTGGVWFLTRGAQVVHREPGGKLTGALLWGIASTAALEAPRVPFRMIDLERGDTAVPTSLLDQLLYPDQEARVAQRAGARWVQRVVRIPTGSSSLRLPEEPGWRLARDAGGALESLQTELVPVQVPGPGEIRVAVDAAGLNFHDVLVALGEVDPDSPLGMEACGRVLATGPDVTEFAAGDQVAGFATGVFGPEVVTRANLTAKAPAGMSAAKLATVPVTFVTVALAFDLADLKAGQRVLVHAAAGGVGLAAIQLARQAGAEVIATASAPKRAYVRSLGVDHVFDSRQTGFGKEILAATDGAGVDVVLNSLVGPGFIEASLSCLGLGGTFVELSRRETWTAEKMSTARADVAYHMLSVDQLVAEQPVRVGSVLRDLMAQIEAGDLEPLPFTSWPLAEAGAAMEYMRSGRHVGKVVLTPSPLAGGRLREDGTYLVTGGLGGIGRLVAGWLADRGARWIVLNGRRGPDAAVEEEIQLLRKRGVTVRLELADMADEAAVAGMLERVGAEMPPLAGVVHSAGAVADAALGHQTWERFEDVLGPKVLGAWHLHCATQSLNLDLFLLFSSVAGVLGNPGQANHAAANVFLDQLARHRRSMGLAGQSIAWGPWSGLGEAEERRAVIARRLEAVGLGWISPQQGLRALDRLVRADVSTGLAAVVDWPRHAARHSAPPQLLAEMLPADEGVIPRPPPPRRDLAGRLRQASAEEREALLVEHVQGELQAVLRLEAPPDPTTGFFDLGMDSLMATELRNRLNRMLGDELEVSGTAVFDYPHSRGLARHLAAELGEPASEQPIERRITSRDQGGAVAIVGMACRFPGAASLQAFWRQLDAGADAVTDSRPVPASIGSGPGRAGYIGGIDTFDAEFFRIAPVEARLMDPQQRMLLETSWEALEEAGIDPDGLSGSRAGVYAGIASGDYRELVLGAGTDAIGLHAATGTSYAAAIGRVAYALGLEGPAIAVDTACSSSLVAVHQATAALQRGEADLALAGGVNAILTATSTESFARAGMLSPDGNCKTFDAAADGFVRGEGCGMVVLKRLEDAEADGDRIWAVIRGSAVNQDGASAGLTVPNGPAQERVIEEALQRAGMEPAEVDYLEAHGTGTELGDPIEVHAAAAVYGRGRPAEKPLLLGSVKTNIGHLEAAAGAAGLIKAVLAMSRSIVPPSLHFREPNPRIDWEGLPVRVVAEADTWPAGADRPPCAAVSSFGFSGTNSHLIVQGHRIPDRRKGDGGPSSGRPVLIGSGVSGRDGRVRGRRGKRILPLSGKSDQAVRDLAGQYLGWLDEQQPVGAEAGEPEKNAVGDLLADMAWTAGTGRSHFSHRAGVAFDGRDDLQGQLAALAAGGTVAQAPEKPRVAFAFTGQGSHWPGMGRELYETEPAARDVLDRCEEVMRELRGASLLAVMFGSEGAAGDLDDTAWTQPALYALECAQRALWASVGVTPAVVLGHSVGELAAATAAGVWGLEEGLRFAAARGELMGGLPTAGSRAGAMLAVFAGAEPVAAALAAWNEGRSGPGLSIAADNGNHHVVSGPARGVKALEREFAKRGIRTERLNARHGFHSALMDPVMDELEAALRGVEVRSPALTLISNLTGRAVAEGELLDGVYWRRHAREPVAFSKGVASLAASGADVLVEVGPAPVLGPLVALSWPAPPGSSDDSGVEADSTPVVLSTMRRPKGPMAEPSSQVSFADAVAGIYEAGSTLDFEGLFSGERRRRVSLPTYAFQRRRFWIDSSRRHAVDGHPLLGVRHDSPGGDVTFETELFASDPTWVADHRVYGLVVVPAAMLAVLAIEGASLALRGRPALIEDLRLHAPLVLPEEPSEGTGGEAGRTVQVIVGRSEAAGERPVQIYSRAGDQDPWTLHAETVARADAPEAGAKVDLKALEADLSSRAIAEFYRGMADSGIEYGPFFRVLASLRAGPDAAMGELDLPGDPDDGALIARPIALDGCFQVLAAIGAVGSATYLPFALERFWLSGRLPDRLVCHARLRAGAVAEAPEVLAVDLQLYAADGTEVGRAEGLTVKRATQDSLLASEQSVSRLLYEVAWRERPRETGPRSAAFLVDPDTVGRQLGAFEEYLGTEGVSPADQAALSNDLERLAQHYATAALSRLGWKPESGSTEKPAQLRRRLKVIEDQALLFARILEIAEPQGRPLLGHDGAGEQAAEDEAGPNPSEADLEALTRRLCDRHPSGATELGLLRTCGQQLSDVLRGRVDPVALLFTEGAGALDLYWHSPLMRAANRMVGDAVAAAVAGLPAGRRLRVLEVGAGTGSATAAVLAALPSGSFDYSFTDVSAGFFAEAEERFGKDYPSVEFRVLDIEADPGGQGFGEHQYDLVLTANVLHATRDMEVMLAHCRALLAPHGQLVALELLRRQDWLDLTFGLLEQYGKGHPPAGASVWRKVLADAGFPEVAVLESATDGSPWRHGLIMARGPAEVAEPPGLWVLASTGPFGKEAARLAEGLAARNQTVVLATGDGVVSGESEFAGLMEAHVEPERREAWHGLLEGLPDEPVFRGVVHLAGLEGRGTSASGADLEQDTRRIGATALALVQALVDAGSEPTGGVWFVTRGAQVVQREWGRNLAGAVLWGLGNTAALEAPGVRFRMIDLEFGDEGVPASLFEELLRPDAEAHVAHRAGRRWVQRLVQSPAEASSLRLPKEPGWRLARDPGGTLESLQAELAPVRVPGPGEIRVAVDAAGLNFHDVLIALGEVDADSPLGMEACGRVLATGQDVTEFAIGDRVAGLAIGVFGPEVVTRADLTAKVPAGMSAAKSATVPTTFVTAALAFELAKLKAGQRVLVHAAAGGVGLAAIQLARRAGAEVVATASEPKRAYVRSLGVDHVFDSRQTGFAEEVLAATDGAGVDVVLNSLVGPGFIEASLSCLGPGGTFVELSRRKTWTAAEIATARADVAYHVLAVDRLTEEDPARVGGVLRDVLARIETGDLEPLPFTAWPLAEAGAAMEYMRSGRHVGKVVLTPSPLAGGRLRGDGTYLITGGLGGIGRLVAGWLADRGARWIVLNGRRGPDAAAEEEIQWLRKRGVTVRVELADVADEAAVAGMLERVEAEMPPLAGVVHSAGAVADAALGHQTWERFEDVLGPKVLGAWHLHRATKNLNLNLFLLFSSVAGVLGNPGQANHASANVFLDQLARHRRSMGLAGQSIAWGAWSGLGEAEERRETIANRLEAVGFGWISPQQGLRALDRLVGADVSTGIASVVDWSRHAARHSAPPPLLAEMLPTRESVARQPLPSRQGLVEQLRQLPEAEREELLLQYVQDELQAVLKLEAPPDSTAGFFDLGIDSLMATELRNRLNRALGDGLVVSSTAVFDYPHSRGLARHLAEELGEPSSGEPSQRVTAPRAQQDTVAIVGMACRFPGASSLNAFWRQLDAGADAVTDRRPEPASASAGPGRAGYIDGIDTFDAEFFRIAPVEARLMDPQQRMLLETSWEALEEAGIDPDGLSGSRAGVYAGIASGDYRELVLGAGRDAIGLHAATGTSYAAAIGRVAYALGLEGPAIAVDTACSSSLVAVHQATAALQRGEADLALAGGVNAILSAASTESFARAGMLSPDGRCKTFDAAADGYVRGEGCGMVVLKRLEDAEADGDRIWAVIRGSAVNQDGASAGLTVPNGPAQERVIEEALQRAGMEPAEVDYLEAHGTGTELGDPIEVHAAAAVYGRGRLAEKPLLLGSVKTNIGHLEAAAGAAGLIKAVLAMSRSIVPPSLHFREPNPRIDWEGLPVRVVAEAEAWPEGADWPACAAVSSFGFSGTNAHLIVQAHRIPDRRLGEEGALSGSPVLIGSEVPGGDSGSRGRRILPLSGKSDRAVRDLAGQYLGWLDGQQRIGAEAGETEKDAGGEMLADMAWTAGIGRSHFSHRAGLVFDGRDDLRGKLAALAAGGRVAQAPEKPRAAFVFTGQGSQWPGMGRELYETEPAARDVLDRCEEVMRELRGASLLAVMFGSEGAAGTLDDTAWTQPALYALECAQCALWASAGVTPAVVLGHSVGELAAATAAAVWGLEEGLRFAAARGELMGGLPTAGSRAGAMLAVFAGAEPVAAALAAWNEGRSGPGLSIAADNGNHHVVSGPARGVEAVEREFAKSGVRVERLNVCHGFHSALMDPVMDELEAALGGVEVRPPALTLISNLTGRAVEEGELLDGAYWRRHAREPVAFAKGVASLAANGADVVVELGPSPVLGPLVVLSWPAPDETAALPGSAGPEVGADSTPVVLSTMRRPKGPMPEPYGHTSFADAVAGIYEAGSTLDFEGLFSGERRRRVSLPTYAFQRRRFWIDPSRRRMADGHPLLGVRRDSPGGEVTFETELFASDPAWMADHRVYGFVVVPAAMHAVLAIEGASLALRGRPSLIEDLRLHAPLVLPEERTEGTTGEAGRTVQVIVGCSEAAGERPVQVYSRAGDQDPWTLHAETVARAGAPEAGAKVDLKGLEADLSSRVIAEFYRGMTDSGIEYGPAFQVLSSLWAGLDAAVGELELPGDPDDGASIARPIALDGCFQVLAAIGALGSATYLPFALERAWLSETLPDRLVCHARLRAEAAGDGRPVSAREAVSAAQAPEVFAVDLQLYAADGSEVGRAEGLTVKRATQDSLLASEQSVSRLLYEAAWKERPRETGPRSADFLVDPATVGRQLGAFEAYLGTEGVSAADQAALSNDLERLAQHYATAALSRLGWKPESGSTEKPAQLRRRLKVVEDQALLFARILGIAERQGRPLPKHDGAGDQAADDEPGSDSSEADLEALTRRLCDRHPSGATQLRLLATCGKQLPDVLRGRVDPVALLFTEGAGASDLYRHSPLMRAANRMVGDAVAAAVAGLPAGRRLRVLEVGAGTGSTTAAVLAALPGDSFDYSFTDVSAGFFAEAEERFGKDYPSVEFRVLDIEADPVGQGFGEHQYDLVLAANVLHATRDMGETLAHCRTLLAPHGQLLALELLQRQDWLDLTFGLLNGWWRFADTYRTESALAGESAWRQALADSKFADGAVVGTGEAGTPVLILARGPSATEERPGLWVLAADGSDDANELATQLASHNQSVVVAGATAARTNLRSEDVSLVTAGLDPRSRDEWRSLADGLPRNVPLRGVVHLEALRGQGPTASTPQLAEDATRVAASALALIQGLLDAGAVPENGTWFVTRGAQVVERETAGELAGATLWGMGKTAALEAAELQPRMIDLDAREDGLPSGLVGELLRPDRETHIAYRSGTRYVARLARYPSGRVRLRLPREPGWRLACDADGALDRLTVESAVPRDLGSGEIRLAVATAGLNFFDVFFAMGLVDAGQPLGSEACGTIAAVGSDVTDVRAGDLVAGFAVGAFGPEAVTRADLVAAVPPGLSTAEAATVPAAFVTAALAFEVAGLGRGDRVLVHAGAGGVGQAAIQLARAAGAVVLATASVPKQPYLRSLGVTHVFDSRTTEFGERILEATDGAGVSVVLNSLTGSGFVESSLSCLSKGGRFVELSKRGVWSREAMLDARPDVHYWILGVDRLIAEDPFRVGRSLRGVMARMATGELKPLAFSSWSLAEAGAAMEFMRSARHLGKIVLAVPRVADGRMREDGTYLITGGLGGIGRLVAEWLADRGARSIVLNGRRDPDPAAIALIKSLRSRGIEVQVELADVADPDAVDGMLKRIRSALPPLVGVIHSVGSLSDGSLANQDWTQFERALWSKILGAWHLHRATERS